MHGIASHAAGVSFSQQRSNSEATSATCSRLLTNWARMFASSVKLLSDASTCGSICISIHGAWSCSSAQTIWCGEFLLVPVSTLCSSTGPAAFRVVALALLRISASAHTSCSVLQKSESGDPRPGLLCEGDRTCSCGNDVMVGGESCQSACCAVFWLELCSAEFCVLANACKRSVAVCAIVLRGALITCATSPSVQLATAATTSESYIICTRSYSFCVNSRSFRTVCSSSFAFLSSSPFLGLD